MATNQIEYWSKSTTAIRTKFSFSKYVHKSSAMPPRIGKISRAPPWSLRNSSFTNMYIYCEWLLLWWCLVVRARTIQSRCDGEYDKMDMWSKKAQVILARSEFREEKKCSNSPFDKANASSPLYFSTIEAKMIKSIFLVIILTSVILVYIVMPPSSGQISNFELEFIVEKKCYMLHCMIMSPIRLLDDEHNSTMSKVRVSNLMPYHSVKCCINVWKKA